MVLDDGEQLIVDERAPHVATAESFPAHSLTAASAPSVDSTGRPTPVHRTRPTQWGASTVPPAPATLLPLQSQWGHYKPPIKPTVPLKETPKPSAAAVKEAPPVAAPQPRPRDETPAPPVTGNGEYLLPVFYVGPFGTAVAMQETHHLHLFSFTDSFLEQSLDPSGISMRSTMFPSTALPQRINGPIPSYQTITTRSCASSGSAPTGTSTNEDLNWPEASLLKRTVCTGRSVTATVSQSSSTSYTRLVGITAFMSSTPPQPCERSKNATLRPTMTNSTYGATSKRMISVTPRQNVLDIFGARGKEYHRRLFYHENMDHPLLPIWEHQYRFKFTAWTQPRENLIAQVVFPLKNPGVDRNEVNAILHYFRKETRDTLQFQAICKEPEKVIHFYHLLQVNVPDRWPRAKVTEPGRSDAVESADSKLPAAAMPDSSH